MTHSSTPLQRGRVAVVFATFTLLLTTQFLGNFTRVGSPDIPDQWQADVFETFRKDADRYITDTLEIVRTNGVTSTGGFFVRKGEIYTTCSGLQAQVAIAGFKLLGGNVRRCAKVGHFLFALAAAMLLTGFLLRVSREYGTAAAVTGVLLLLCSDWLVFVARNLYFMYFLMLAPFVFSFLSFPKVLDDTKFRFGHFLAITGVLILLCALRGYEYITNIILSASIGPIYYGLLRGERLRRIGFRIAMITAVGLAAFGLAMVINVVQASAFLGSFDKGFESVWGKALARTFGPNTPGQQYHDSAPPGVTISQMLNRYLALEVLSVPFLGDKARFTPRIYLTLGAAIAAFAAFLLGVCTGVAAARRRLAEMPDEARRLFALCAATVWGLGAALSWTILAKGHAYHHLHMNGVSFYIPFLPMFYALLGAGVSLIIRQSLNRNPNHSPSRSRSGKR
ncbi:hypothetical protein ACFLSJ_07205 [Verrucomicrobiota bacterium]